MVERKFAPDMNAAKTGQVFSVRVSQRTAVWGITVALVVALVILVLPAPAGLSSEGKRMAALLLMALILWATEALPIAITALLVVIAQSIFQVAELQAAFNSFV